MSRKYSAQDRAEAIAKLRDWLKPGDTVHTVLRHCSRSGMQRTIGLVLVKTGEDGKPYTLHPNHAVAAALDMPLDKDRDGVKIGGCGMDMGFAIVYGLSRTLFPDGFACERGRNGDTSGWDKDGGYALKHSWL